MPALPVHHPPSDFDLFEVLPSEMAALAGYTGVQIIESVASILLPHQETSATWYKLRSGPSSSPGAVHIYFDVAVPDNFTTEVSFQANNLPPDFTNIPGSHLFFGAVDNAGCCAGLFFSKTGISYTGSVDFTTTDLKVNSPIQFLPGSGGLLEEGKYYTIRIAVDSSTQIAYVYVTEQALVATIGHQLKFILPALVSDDGLLNPGDEVVFSVCGTNATNTEVVINTIMLGAGLLIPNMPPVADPGKDQAVRSCSIVRFDGRASFDPEGVAVAYKWRLIDGPDTSVFVLHGHDGYTLGGGTTAKFRSATVAAFTGSDFPVAGDVLLVGEDPYDIIGTGSDGDGFYVELADDYLTSGLTALNFKLLKKNALSGATEAQPTFYPDVIGLYRFDLTVYDGDLYSVPEMTLVNVVDSPIPRGITPDLTFLWGYISDFWKLVEDTEVVETFWGALAQIAASELLALWQHDYGKSLRDIQRTFQRKWLHYDLYLRDPFPEVTTVEHIYGGIMPLQVQIAGMPAADVPGKVTVSSPLFDDTIVRLQPTGATMFAPEMLNQLLRQFSRIDSRFAVTLYADKAGVLYRLMVTAPFPFSMTMPSGTVYTNGLPSGTTGTSVGKNTYVVDWRLDLAGVKEGDFLVVDGTAYYISRVVTDPTDSWTSQRVITRDALPLTIGKSWVIARGIKSKFLDFYRSLCSAGDEALIEVIDSGTQEVIFVSSTVISAADGDNTRLLVDTYAAAPYLARPDLYSVYFHSVSRRTFIPVDPLVVGVPTLQELIVNTDDSAVLRQNVDFYREEFRGQSCLRFLTRANSSSDVWQDTTPPQMMWAETSFIDNRPTIEGNFGSPAGFLLDDLAKMDSSADYLSVVRGLWYSYFNGPTLFNLRAGTQILLGLPYAEADGVIEEIRADFSSRTGRILIRDNTEAEIVRSYTYPSILDLEVNPDTGVAYAEGDTVKLFAPLVTGVEVKDYIKDPTWFEGYLNQGVFYEVEKFFKFLVRIDSAAFSLNTLVFVQSFIKRIKPTYTYPKYVVLKKLPDGTGPDIVDSLLFKGYLYLKDWPGSFSRADTIFAYPSSSGKLYGHLGGAFDDVRPAGGGRRGKFDSDEYDGTPTPGAAPTHPTATTPIHWGYDRTFLCPSDVIVGKMTLVTVAPFSPTFDSIFSYDMPTFDTLFGVFSGTHTIIPSTGYAKLGDPVVVAVGGNLNNGIFQFRSIYPLAAVTTVVIEVVVNNVVVKTINMAIPAAYDYISALPIIPDIVLAPNDIVTVRLSKAASDLALPGGGRFYVALGHGSGWAYDGGPGGYPAPTPMPAGTYVAPRML
jgi:hypothetical protein